MNKFRNTPTVLDGHRFPSKAEANRYAFLKLLVRAGEIKDLKLQPKYALKVNGELIGNYIGDFEYVETNTNSAVLEDVKGVATPIFKWKAKHLKAQYGIDVRIVK